MSQDEVAIESLAIDGGQRRTNSVPKQTFSESAIFDEDAAEVELDLDTVVRALTRTANDPLSVNLASMRKADAERKTRTSSEPAPASDESAITVDTVASLDSSSCSEKDGYAKDESASLSDHSRLKAQQEDLRDSVATNDSTNPLEVNGKVSRSKGNVPLAGESAAIYPEPPVLETGQHYLIPGAFRMTTSWSEEYDVDEPSPRPPSLTPQSSGGTASPRPPHESDYIVEASLVMDADDFSEKEDREAAVEVNRMEMALVEAKPVVEDHPWKSRRVLCAVFLLILAAAGAAVGITLGVSRSHQQSESDPSQSNIEAKNVSSPMTATGPTQAPTLSLAPTPAPTELVSFFRSSLPNYTLAAMEDEKSPQYRAYQWVSEELPYENNTLLRITQRFALATLYFATDGSNWEHQENWLNSSAHECTWYFHPDIEYSCLDGDDTICGIGLEDNGLSGTLPPELSLLSSLEILMIESNPDLVGSVPETVQEISSLSQVYFSDNKLSGYLPELNPAAEDVFLWRNQLSGSVPDSYAQLSLIDTFEVSSNMLTGTFSEKIFGNWTTASWIGVGDNRLQGSISSSLGLLSKLTILDLSMNELSGTLPTEIGRLTAGSTFYFGGSSLTGPLPSELGLLRRMQTLDLSGNSFSGTVPSELGMMTSIEQLYLETNVLTGSLPSELTSLVHVQSLYVYGNQLNGTIPSEIGRLSNLQLLHLEENLFSGTIPRELGKLSAVTELWLSTNGLTETIPTELGLLQGLTELHLEDNLLSGEIPSELGSLSALTGLYLQENNFNGTVPAELCALVNSSKLELEIDCDKVSCDCACSCGNSTSEGT